MTFHRFTAISLIFSAILLSCGTGEDTAYLPQFEFCQPDLFGESGTLTNAWADYDNDGDLDLFVGFRNKANRLYRNDDGFFTDVAGEVGLADTDVTRASAWGDYNNDGFVDIYIGFPSGSDLGNRLYRNDGGRRFTDVTTQTGVNLSGGNTRQVCWIDYDGDGDLDLFIALRDLPNILFRNDGGRFTDVAGSLEIDDTRRTVGAVWFDFDKDGDLDLFNANMDGDANGFYRNDRTHFTDIAEALGVDSGGRQLGSPDNGSVRPSLVDYDNDGFIDIYMANYGPNTLYRNQNGSSFGDVGAETGLAIDSRYDTGTWGDFDNDGYQDLYVNGTITGGVSYRDYLFHNDRGTFTDVTPENILLQEADHGAHWVDFDRDGDLDLSLTGAAETGMHHLFRNMLPENRRTSSIQVMVLDENGHATRAGSEVRLFSADNRTLLGAGILDTGSGYNSQNVMPVHIGLGDADMINIEITIMTGGTRKSTEFTDIDPNSYAGRVFTVRIDPEGRAIR